MAAIELRFLDHASTTLCEKGRPDLVLLIEQMRLDPA
jgi:hypothetical protein